MKDIIEKVNVTKVYSLIQETMKQVKEFNLMEREVFFNAMNKSNLLADSELCDNMLGVAFKKRQPELKNLMGALKGKLAENIKKLTGQQEDDK